MLTDLSESIDTRELSSTKQRQINIATQPWNHLPTLYDVDRSYSLSVD